MIFFFSENNFRVAEIQGETRWGTNCSPHPPLNLKDQFTPLSYPQIIWGDGSWRGNES